MNSIVLTKKSLKNTIELTNSMVWRRPCLRLAGWLAGWAGLLSHCALDQWFHIEEPLKNTIETLTSIDLLVLKNTIESMTSIVFIKKSLKSTIELTNSMVWGKPGLRLVGWLAGWACLRPGSPKPLKLSCRLCFQMVS